VTEQLRAVFDTNVFVSALLSRNPTSPTQELMRRWPEAVVPVVNADPDDDQILACATVGEANYLVTYDPHFDLLEGMYRGIEITKALSFLWKVRGDQPPGS
jgi:predicted nucleic acid-binding protein